METKILIRLVILLVLISIFVAACLFYVKPLGEGVINYFVSFLKGS